MNIIFILKFSSFTVQLRDVYWICAHSKRLFILFFLRSYAHVRIENFLTLFYHLNVILTQLEITVVFITFFFMSFITQVFLFVFQAYYLFLHNWHDIRIVVEKKFVELQYYWYWIPYYANKFLHSLAVSRNIKISKHFVSF